MPSVSKVAHLISVYSARSRPTAFLGSEYKHRCVWDSGYELGFGQVTLDRAKNKSACMPVNRLHDSKCHKTK